MCVAFAKSEDIPGGDSGPGSSHYGHRRLQAVLQGGHQVVYADGGQPDDCLQLSAELWVRTEIFKADAKFILLFPTQNVVLVLQCRTGAGGNLRWDLLHADSAVRGRVRVEAVQTAAGQRAVRAVCAGDLDSADVR